MRMFEVENVLIITIFIKLAQCAWNFNVISNGTMAQAQAPFDSVLNPMISDQKKGTDNAEVQNGLNLIQMTDDFYIRKHSTSCVLQYMI